LADFQKWIKISEKENVKIFAGSVDSLEKAKEAVEKTSAAYPVAYGMDANAISKITGAYYDQDRKYLQPAGFLVRPDNTIDVACYSSGPVGRIVAKNVLGLVKFYKKQKTTVML